MHHQENLLSPYFKYFYFMGTIAKQTLRGSVFTYAGILLGFVTTGLLFPRYLSDSQIGAISLIIKYASLLTILANLGFNSVGIRLFPYFRDSEKQHNGYLKLNLLVTSAGLILCLFLYYIFEEQWVIANSEKSPIFAKYIPYIIPFTFSIVIFNVLNGYSRLVFDALTGTFLKEFVQRLIILIGILLLIAGIIDFDLFVPFYLVATFIPVAGLLYMLGKNKELKLGSYDKVLNSGLKKQVIHVSFFGALNSIGSTLVTTIDTIMVNAKLDEAHAGVYGTMAMFGVVIIAPSRSLIGIATTFLSEAWKANDKEEINKLMKKSSINQLLFSILVFIGVWANLDIVFEIIPEKFKYGKDVVLYLGLGGIMTMAIGIVPSVIMVSKHYKWQTYLLLIFSLIIVFTNLYFIPKYGIVGAGIASLVAISIHCFNRLLFVWWKFKLQPFSKETILVLVVGLVTYGAQSFIPALDNPVLNLIVRSLIIVVVFTSATYPLKISEDFNRQVDKGLALLGVKK